MDTPGSAYPTFSWTDRKHLSQALAQAHDVRLYRRLRAVAEIADGEPVDVVAKRARVGRSTVYRWIKRYLAERTPSALADRRRSGRPRTTSVLTDKKLRQLLTSDRCRFGYDANTWTVPLLATHLRTQGVVISARTLRRRIRAARFRWKRPRYVYSKRAEHVGAKKRLCCLSSVVSPFADLTWTAAPQDWRDAPPPLAALALTHRSPCQPGVCSA